MNVDYWIAYSSALCVFFFSSRRRHTRFKCDWSSDVCSSDLKHEPKGQNQGGAIMCAAKTHQAIGGAAKTDQRSANFEVKVGLRLTGNAGIPQVENRAKE